MLKAPKVPLPYRVITFTIALVIGLCTLEFYEAGAKFVRAVANYRELEAKQAVEKELKARHDAAAEQQRFKEPGVVGVQIIATPPKKDDQPK